MKKKEVNAKQCLCFTTETTLNNIADHVELEMGKMMAEMESKQIQISGPIEFIYFDVTGDPDKTFKLEFAVPVKEEKNIDAPYQYKSVDSFECMTHLHEGSLENLYGLYDELYKELEWNKIKPSNQVREVYLNYEGMSSEKNITEIQIGIAD